MSRSFSHDQLRNLDMARPMNLLEPLNAAWLIEGNTSLDWQAHAAQVSTAAGDRLTREAAAAGDQPKPVVSDAIPRLAFGRCVLVPQRRELLRNDRPVKLGGRAYDVLMALVEKPGAVIGKDRLMARVWPSRVVEENALQAQISALRTALGAERALIRTVAGRGYQFTGDIRVLSEQLDECPDPAVLASRPSNLSEPVSALIGRDRELREIRTLVAEHRLVTVTGAGGMGKTRLAMAVAQELLPRFDEGTWFADLAPLKDAGLVPITVAAAVGIELTGGSDSIQCLAKALGRRKLLLVLDNCEHVIAAAAAVAEALLRAGSSVRIIATSREPLRAEGEQVYPLAPLALPNADDDDPARCGALGLFLDRAQAHGAHLNRDDPGTIALITQLCRSLDSMPLAIELAAARAAALGLPDLVAQIGDRFDLLTTGRRTASARHRTLQATFDWSHELLSEPQRVILRRLAVFAGEFRLQAAVAVASGGDLSHLEVVDGLADLVSKSLVIVEFEGGVGRHRLLETTRAYALVKFEESGDVQTIRRSHAEYYRILLETAGDTASDNWPAIHAADIDDIRAALEWAFGPEGDPSIAVALARASIPIWFEKSLLGECRGWIEKALSVLDMVEGAPRQAVVLQYPLLNARGINEQTRSAPTSARELAERLGIQVSPCERLSGLPALAAA